MFEGIFSGRTRVLDLAYAINDKLVPWPGDNRWFEASVNASVAKDGYFTRSFWMLEHYGTHLDAPIHFPPGTIPVDEIPYRSVGETARANSRGRHRGAQDGLGVALA
jgi:kynurenine formamidase